jgi:hypothetical protein
MALGLELSPETFGSGALIGFRVITISTRRDKILWAPLKALRNRCAAVRIYAMPLIAIVIVSLPVR